MPEILSEDKVIADPRDHCLPSPAVLQKINLDLNNIHLKSSIYAYIERYVHLYVYIYIYKCLKIYPHPFFIQGAMAPGFKPGSSAEVCMFCTFRHGELEFPNGRV